MGGGNEPIEVLQLARTPRVGPVTYSALIRRFGSAKAALAALPELAKRGGGKAPKPPARARIEDEIAALQEAGCKLLVKGSADFPPHLEALEDCPAVLTLRGHADLLNKPMIAMVGARNASTIGRKLASTLAAELGREGVVVASGMARGIDTAAHVGALEHGTVAVLAGGIDRIYPKENTELYHALCERGAVLSEMPWGAEPKAPLFPRRNRIVSGMSLGVIVVEAAQRSGSLITARMAGEQGRQVYAVPGNPMDPRAAGANHLIREGAILIRSAEDVLDDLAPQLSGVAMPRQTFLSQHIAHTTAQPDAAARARLLDALSAVPTLIDDIIRDTGLKPEIVAAAALELELAGKLERHTGGRLARAA
ncbi:MAG: DNA-processing protein DprA [Pseudomonadota bacterium]